MTKEEFLKIWDTPKSDIIIDYCEKNGIPYKDIHIVVDVNKNIVGHIEKDYKVK